MLLNYYEKESANYVLIEDNNFTDDFISEYKKLLQKWKIRYSTGFIIKPEVNEIIDNMINDFALEGEELQEIILLILIA